MNMKSVQNGQDWVFAIIDQNSCTSTAESPVVNVDLNHVRKYLLTKSTILLSDILLSALNKEIQRDSNGNQYTDINSKCVCTSKYLRLHTCRS